MRCFVASITIRKLDEKTKKKLRVRAAQLDIAANTVEEAQIQLAEERSSLEDTDVAATIMRLNAKTLSLQAAQSAFAKVNRNTLFDFLG